MLFRGVVRVSLGIRENFCYKIDNLAAQKFKSRQFFIIKPKNYGSQNWKFCVVKSQILHRKTSKTKKKENQKKHGPKYATYTLATLQVVNYSIFTETQCVSQ